MPTKATRADDDEQPILKAFPPTNSLETANSKFFKPFGGSSKPSRSLWPNERIRSPFRRDNWLHIAAGFVESRRHDACGDHRRSSGSESPSASRFRGRSRAGLRDTICIVPSGEGSKSVEQLSELWSRMLADKTDRASVIIAIGGGVVGDLAGFAAATFRSRAPFHPSPHNLVGDGRQQRGGQDGDQSPVGEKHGRSLLATFCGGYRY